MRFFALKNWRHRFRHDVTDFLTEYMEAISDPDAPIEFDYEREERVFQKTFDVLAKTLGDTAFSRANKTRTGLVRGFGIYQFEAFTVGIQRGLDAVDLDSEAQLAQLKPVMKEVKMDAAFVELTSGGGKNSPGPLNERIAFVRERVPPGA